VPTVIHYCLSISQFSGQFSLLYFSSVTSLCMRFYLPCHPTI